MVEIVLIGCDSKNNRTSDNNTDISFIEIIEKLDHFRELTIGNPIIVGRRTFEKVLEYNDSPLIGRKNIILSNEKSFQFEEVYVKRNIDSALEEAGKNSNIVYIIGGKTTYNQFLSLANRIILSESQSRNLDLNFPEFDRERWRVTDVSNEREFSIKFFEKSE